MTATPFTGGGRVLRASAAAGLAGLALTALGGLSDPRQALASYLVAFVYWLGIALGALILLGAFHASKARWPVVLRRFLETIPQVIPLFALLFLPIALGLRHLFVWVDPGALDGELRHLVEHKRPYLNVPFFLVRAAVYFVLWSVVAHLLRAWSVRQDADGGHALTLKQRRLGAGSLPFLALTLSFAAFDWMMSLDPRFYSTIFGVYWFAGSFVGAFAVLAIAAAATRGDPGQFGHHLNADHLHSLGKFLLAFTAFWAYIAFSQFMLIWIANVPEEVPWYLVRTGSPWGAVGVFLALGHFLVPFFLLLSRDLKRSPTRLAAMSGWMLLVHWVDVHWVIMPRIHEAGPSPSWMDVTAFVGVGGAALAFLVLRMRGAATVPVRDPYLEESLRYEPE
ncbi:MAG TPA: hypothetical protein VFP50_14225 [Anaeromyxobacteraceae bacterium]|nr:hypothetical protein [Anaeromyxobacteraceae bacterium]